MDGRSSVYLGARLSVCLSVRLTVCLSACFDHGGMAFFPFIDIFEIAVITAIRSLFHAVKNPLKEFIIK